MDADTIPVLTVEGHTADEPEDLPPVAIDILDTQKDPNDLASALRTLMRRSNQEYLDRGLWVLYLAFGTLSWTEADDTRYTSPLLLVPVRLVSTGPRQMPTLEAVDEDPTVNPALSLKLSQLGIALPTVDDIDDVVLSDLLGDVRVAVGGQPDWQVNDTVSLSYFSFAKEAMYRDLLDNEELVALHPAIGVLATGGRGVEVNDFLFDEILDANIDTAAQPETTPMVLDADSSQRACIAAALDGRSFVMDGPPGTGKSQTISNMIGALLCAGRSVLFVSEKAAALEVVKNRLTAAGLGAYLLELHSHKATRREVAAALGEALDTVPVAPHPMSTMDVTRARQRREELNAYADAINNVREPLGYSLHDVIGIIANLNDVAVAPATGIAPVDLTVESFSQIRAAAHALSRAWRPAAQGRSFVWRGVAEAGALDATLYQAASAIEVLTGVVHLNAAVSDVLALTRPSQADTLAAILSHTARRPAGLPDAWLSMETLDGVRPTIDQLASDLAEILASEGRAITAAGTSWRAIPSPASVPFLDPTRLHGLTPPAVSVNDLDADGARAVAAVFASDAHTLQTRLGSMSGLAAMLGLPPASSFADADDLLTVAGLADAAERPERAWLSSQGLERAGVAAAAVGEAIRGLNEAEAAASVYFTPGALGADTQSLARRFTHEHHGLKKLAGQYREDKRAAAAFTRPGIDKRVAHEHLPLAAAWQQAAQSFEAVSVTHAPILGSYYTGRATDFNQLAVARNNAYTAVQRARTIDLTMLGNCIARDATINAALVSLVHDTRRDLQEWAARLAPEPLPAARPELLFGSLADAVRWLEDHVEPLRTGADLADRVCGAIGRLLTIGKARELIELRSAVELAHSRLAANANTYRETFGNLYADEHTSVAAVTDALAWTAETRRYTGAADKPLSVAQIKVLEHAVPAEHLAEAARQWVVAKTGLMDAFDTSRRDELAIELDDYVEAADLITALRADTAGKEEWFAYRRARAMLEAYGLRVAIDFCVAERIGADEVPRVVERALLQEWADYQLSTDSALSTVRAEDRDQLVAEYRALDRQLIASATGDIIRACNARRPRNDIGQAAIIRREAGKKRRHMPVRLLMERASHVVQAIKPCFMMSPLAVSQYLPPDMRFDVVVFDEASQVSPGDAINCIYRGTALITAGDQKQLPPTNFFASTGVDDAEEWTEETENAKDFESILDLAKASGAYKSLTLRWHYRSRHESLIAFSNAAFYSGRLITFPGADDDGPNVGIELFVVDGVYRRGSSRDNVIEAAFVAERVIHHFDTRPNLTLGVVTFSEAQAATVETAVDQARLARPDLDRFFTGDRLGGFFVKNLESVQGDERDVMIFSIGYGPDEHGARTNNFGPVNRGGGWRRLNVAITRARYRNEIVSSTRAGDITASTTSEGVRQLRRYLDFAQRGIAALALDTSSGGDAESPFEESVISAIRSWGYDVAPQVGAAGYRIDIGIRHPDYPGVYVLGIECDGFQYHSSKVARDRDRLREQVLRGLGWHLHRIWGTAWYRNRNGEEERLRAAIERAVAAPIRGLLGGLDGGDRIDRPVVVVEAATFASAPDWAVPYETAAVAPLARWIDPSDMGSRFEIAPAITNIATIEGPVHMSVVHERLRTAWNIGRVGARIRDNIEYAAIVAKVLREGDFIRVPNTVVETVRTPTDACARTVEQVHDDELALSLVNLVRDAGAIGQDDLTASVARVYGWARRGQDISTRLLAVINRLLETGALHGDAEALTVAKEGPSLVGHS